MPYTGSDWILTVYLFSEIEAEWINTSRATPPDYRRRHDDIICLKKKRVVARVVRLVAGGSY